MSGFSGSRQISDFRNHPSLRMHEGDKGEKIQKQLHSFDGSRPKHDPYCDGRVVIVVICS